MLFFEKLDMCLLFLRICDQLWYLGCCRSPCHKETSAVWVYSVQPAYNTGINHLSLTSWQEKWLDSSGIARTPHPIPAEIEPLDFQQIQLVWPKITKRLGYHPQTSIFSAAIGTKWQVPDQHPHARCLFAAETCKNIGSGIPPILTYG